ncbi:MAG: hypothetical protein IKD10_09165 [Lentisphaeria bacterium]|nr:hypothetical protein [Lentisphaerota bacterium]MBR7145094.1 hypothetical protein [Lentisphaeria bacterium]
MKLQTRHTTSHSPVRRRNKDQKSWALKLYILVYLLVVVLTVFAVANYRIDLNSKISELQRLSNRAKQEIYELERDIQALKNSRENLSSWANVRYCINKYNLPFRASEPGQIRMLTIKSHRNIPMAVSRQYEEKTLTWQQR